MNQSTKWIVGVIVVVAIVAIGYFVSKGPSGPVSTEPIKIGFIGPLTGDQAIYGSGVREGFDLALSEFLNLKFKGKPIQIIYEDTGGDVKNAVSAFQKLTEIDKVSAIIQAGASQEAVALIKVAQDKRVPMYAVISQAPELTEAGDFVFRGMPEILLLANKIAEATFGRGFKKAAILTATYNQATLAARDAFKKDFIELGGSIVDEEGFQKGVNDFRTQLSRIKAANPDVIFLNALTSEAAFILKQKAELGMNQQFVSQGAVEDKKIIEVAKAGSDGVIFATFNAVPPQDFVDKVKVKYGFESRRWNIEGYEAALFLVEALKKAQTFGALGVRNAFAQVKELDGVAGKLLFDDNGNITRSVHIKIIKNGNFELYK